MATITALTYLDGGVARTAGEAMTINGGNLIVRTDTRWHANAPASMTGTLGSATISSTLGGSYEIDGTKVRWLEISGGSGTCAIGTTISQGGVSGYFLGYWASLTSAPSTTIGATGFIKLREVTGGAFSAGALSGITASAVGADKVGWIEVVHDQATAITVPRLGKFQVRGDFFELGVTTGASNQLVQVPTNGSTTAYVAGVWIATTDTPLSDEDYEYYPSLPAANMIAANLGTDIRSKFVCIETNGQIRIGHNGSVAVGYVPPSGRKIRIPNVIGRQCATGTRATNIIPSTTAGTRPDFTTTSAGYIDIENFSTDWYLLFAQPYYVKMHHVATFDYFNISECASPLDLYNIGTSTSLGTIDARTLTITSCFAGGTIDKAVLHRCSAGTTDHAVEVPYSANITFSRCYSGIITFARSSGMAYQVTQSTNIKFNNCHSINSAMQFTTSFDCEVNNHDHSDRFMGLTTTAGIYAIYILASCNNIKVEGVTFGLQGQVANVHPYLGIFNVGQSSNIKLRNIGTREVNLSGGSTNNPAYIFVSAGNNANVRLQRIYMSPTRTGAISTQNSDKGNLYEHVYGDKTDAIAVANLNTTLRNCGGTTATAGQASVYGTHITDYFNADTTGRLLIHFNEPTTETIGYTQSSFSAVSGFTSAGNLSMGAVNDYFQVETPYFIKGHTGFQNVTPTYTGTNTTTNHTFVYQIDTGSGYGAEKALTGANLFSEVVDPSVGFKFKIKCTCSVANTGNLLTYITIQTTSTLVAQRDNLYPLDTITLTLSGLVSGSDIVIRNAGTEVERVNVDSNNSTSYNYVYETLGTVDISVYKRGYIPFSIRNYALSSSNASLPIAQVQDRNYIE